MKMKEYTVIIKAQIAITDVGPESATRAAIAELLKVAAVGPSTFRDFCDVDAVEVKEHGN